MKKFLKSIHGKMVVLAVLLFSVVVISTLTGLGPDESEESLMTRYGSSMRSRGEYANPFADPLYTVRCRRY